MSTAREKISVDSLRDVTVLFEGDIHELAQLLLRINDAKTRGTNTIARPTVHGLATVYCNLSRVEFEDIIRVFERHGLPLGAVVEHPKDMAEPSAPPNRRLARQRPIRKPGRGGGR